MADLDHLHPEFRRRVEATGVAVNSGARSHARQAQLYQCRQDKLRTGVCNCPDGCNPANMPGSSWHEFDEGAAFPNTDSAASPLVGGAWAMAVDFAEPYPHGADGLCFPIPGEPWHGQPSEVTESYRVVGAWRRLPTPAPPVDPDPLHTNGRLMLAIGAS